jgi:lanosterol synthase
LGVTDEQRISDKRLFQAIDFILERQNRDGGFGTYERARAGVLIERLNPSEMYTGCMTDRSHVECTASCITALARFRAHFPTHQNKIDNALSRAIRFLKARQNSDGSFPAAWGIHFTYSAFFVTDALLSVGIPPTDHALSKLATWLLQRQRRDGGWGEHYTSCFTGRYMEHTQSQALMTAWALMALTPIIGSDHMAVLRARRFLNTLHNRETGWPRQSAGGVFFGTAVLDYRLYKEIFPVWALVAAS